VNAKISLERASIRGIDPLEVKEALLNGEIIEDYPEDKRGHSCLVYGKTRIGRDIHVLCDIAYDILWIIRARYTNRILQNGLSQIRGG